MVFISDFAGEKAWIAGWGSTKEGEPNYPSVDFLRKAAMKLIKTFFKKKIELHRVCGALLLWRQPLTTPLGGRATPFRETLQLS